MRSERRTESPVRHGSRSTDEGSILINDTERGGPSKEVKVKNTPNDLISQGSSSIEHIHAITIEQQNRMGISLTVHIPKIHIHRVGPIQIGIKVDGGDVSSVECVGVIGIELNPVRLCVLP